MAHIESDLNPCSSTAFCHLEEMSSTITCSWELLSREGCGKWQTWCMCNSLIQLNACRIQTIRILGIPDWLQWVFLFNNSYLLIIYNNCAEGLTPNANTQGAHHIWTTLYAHCVTASWTQSVKASFKDSRFLEITHKVANLLSFQFLCQFF